MSALLANSVIGNFNLQSPALLLALLVTWAVPAGAASFQGLGDLPGGNFFSVAAGVSDDGQVVAGYSVSANGYEAFRWTPQTGIIGLGDLPGGTFSSYANAISADGSTIVGFSRSASGSEAFRWTAAEGMVGLGDLPGGYFDSRANAVSADGQVIIGEASSTASGTRSEAFRWTAATGMVGLGDLPGGNFNSHAFGVSADGSVVIGESSATNNNEAFRWTAATGMVGLGDLPGGIFNSIAYAISADGSTIVGYGTIDSNGTHEAFRWTAATGMAGLGNLSCDTWSIARTVSGDGSIILGDPQISTCRCVFIWDAQHGMRDLQEALSTEYGLNVTGWQFCRATAISTDGLTIVGYGVNPSGYTEAWLADLRPPRLGVARAGNDLLLFWPANNPNLLLEQAPSLGADAIWSPNPAPVSVAGDHFVVTNRLESDARFFRLRRP